MYLFWSIDGVKSLTARLSLRKDTRNSERERSASQLSMVLK